MCGDVFEQNEFYAVASDLFDAAEADMLAIAKLVELAWLRSQYSAEMMSGVSRDDRGVTAELINEKSSAHGWSLTADCGKR